MLSEKWLRIDDEDVGAQIYIVSVVDMDRAECTALLDDGERERAAAYVAAERRDEFVLGRALARAALAADWGVPDARLEGAEGEKPRLVAAPGTRGVALSLSHSGGTVALAVVRERAIGVDLEVVRPVPAELREAALRDEERAAAAGDEDFFKVWTAKEAYMKLRGAGLAIAPKRLHVDLERGVVRDTELASEQRFQWFAFLGVVVTWAVDAA